MSSFSVARAYSAGVDLVERKPWTLAWWAVAVIILQMLPRLLIPALMGGTNEFTAVRDVWAAMGDPQQMAGAASRLQQAQAANHFPGLGALWFLWNLLVSAVLYNAAFRSVLQPGQSSFGYLRFGAAELWQFVTLLVQTVLLFGLGIAIVLAVIVGALIAKAAGPAAGWVLYGLVVLLMILTVWLVLRLSLGTVATFAEKRFALFKSWRLTKGRAWRLFWTSFLTLAMIIGLFAMFIYSLIFAFIPFAALLPHGQGPGLVPLTQGPPAVPTEYTAVATALLVVWLIVSSLLSAVLHAFTLTPWAVAYRGVTGGDEGK